MNAEFQRIASRDKKTFLSDQCKEIEENNRRSKQSNLKEISPEYSLEGLMLKVKLQYFGQLMRRTDSLEKTDAGKD